MEQCQKQTMHTHDISQIHKQRDILRRTEDANIWDHIHNHFEFMYRNSYKLILSHDFLLKSLNNFKYDLIA